MPSSELSDLTQTTALSDSDIIYVVRSSGTLDRYIRIDDMLDTVPFQVLATQAALDAHIADTTAVHGIPDTAVFGGTLKNQIHITGGNKSLTSTTWANLDTATDITLDADEDDWILANVSFLSSGTPGLYVDAGTLVSGAMTNMFSTGGGAEDASYAGVQAWRGNGSVNTSHGGAVLYQVQAGDIVSGQVTIRWRYRINTAGTKTVNATVDSQLITMAVNLRG